MDIALRKIAQIHRENQESFDIKNLKVLAEKSSNVFVEIAKILIKAEAKRGSVILFLKTISKKDMSLIESFIQ